MKKSLLTLSLAFLVSLSFNSFAHEGHDQAPGTIKSLHGGVVKSGKELNLEVIMSGTEVTLYPISHTGKDLAASSIKLEAMAKPKKGKAYPVVFTADKVGLKATVDLMGANRLPIDVNITSNGKTDKFSIQVEE